MQQPPLVIALTVGLTGRLLAHAPRLQALAERGWSRGLREVTPAVTCTAQASLLTGQPPSGHGVVANGWLFRDTMEIRFWQQANQLIEAPPLYATARARAARRGTAFRCAKLFWWFNQGADVHWSITPKPHYGADGRKVFDIATTPIDLGREVKAKCGEFPFMSFWGPMAGAPSTRWIARAAAEVLTSHRPDLTLVYLPHLDYDPQRFGPSRCDMAAQVQSLDDACAPLLDAAAAIGATVWVVSEYGHCDVGRAVHPNRALRRASLLEIRDGPFGEMLDAHRSRALAVCDHQLAHVYLRDPGDEPCIVEVLEQLPGVARVLVGEQRAEVGLEHRRAGEIVLLAERDAWFAYPYWLDDARAPDFARTVDIHRKPGYDPCEMFFDPKLWFPKAAVAWRLAKKSLGMRTLMDVVPLDASLVGGSHGLPALDPLDRPILIGDGPAPGHDLPMIAFHDLALARLGLAD